MTRLSVAVLLAVLAGCGGSVAPPEGVYTMCRDVAGFSGETIELKGGKFRYWFYSDVQTGAEPAYPLSGSYRISGNALTLDHHQIHDPVRTFAVVNGIQVLWRKDGLEGWEKDQRIHPYAVLIRVEGTSGDPSPDQRPALSTIKSANLQERDKKEYEERYKDQPPEVRPLLRARSQRPDPNLDGYKAELRKAQDFLSPSLIRQLVALIGWHSRELIPAKSILADLYGGGFLLKKDASFLNDPEKRRRALECLIEGIDAARDRYGVEEPLLVFLQATGTPGIKLTIPEAGVHIRLTVHPSGYSSDCGAIDVHASKPKTVQWTDEIPIIIPVVQKWMREQLAK
jgi:hypothetical protein